MAAVAEPLGSGLVDTLARPGGNVTGLSSSIAMLDAKRARLARADLMAADLDLEPAVAAGRAGTAASGVLRLHRSASRRPRLPTQFA